MNIVEILSRSAGRHPVAGRVTGVVIGIVTNLDDPDGQGRLKVKYPWLQDDSESPWARVVSFMAGAGRGGVFRPEVDDEVLVAFEHGDMRRPYVLGGLWNGTDAMPAERGADADNHVRLIKSRSGHLIVLDDTGGEESIRIEDKHGNVVELNADGVTVTSDAIKIGSSGASEGLVLGDAMLELFNQHTHPTGVGPSGPPVEPMQKGTHVSDKHTAE
ncbi:MAG: phage tail protein [bacterium]|nr:phage tail protein [bacterium]